ncbi:MAG: hypothetical protein ABJ059_00120, partial [Hyphomicrobiales bacterium]
LIAAKLAVAIKNEGDLSTGLTAHPVGSPVLEGVRKHAQQVAGRPEHGASEDQRKVAQGLKVENEENDNQHQKRKKRENFYPSERYHTIIAKTIFVHNVCTDWFKHYRPKLNRESNVMPFLGDKRP